MRVFRLAMLAVILQSVVSVFARAEAYAKTYYVAPTGSDGDKGSINEPFRTIQKAADVVNPGDLVIVRDGVYTDTDSDNFIVSLRRGGTSAAWVIFKSENKWGAVLDGQNNTTRFGWNFGANANYVRVENFEIKGCAQGGFWSNSGASQVYIYGNHIHHIGRRVTTMAGGQNGMYQGTSTSHHTYDSNVWHHIGRLPNGNPYDFNHDHGIYLTGKNTTIINNLFHGHAAGWAIHIWGYTRAENILISNNTFADPNPGRWGQLILGGTTSNVVIQNNIFYQPNTGAIRNVGCTTKSDITIQNNLTDVAELIAGDRCAFTIKDNMTSTNPRFVDPENLDFRLLPDSPAVDAGLVIEGLDRDIIGAPRQIGAAIDMGAYEYESASLPAEELPTATITLSDPSPTKAGTVHVTLATSNVVTKVPTPLIFTESDSSITIVELEGSIPGSSFIGTFTVDAGVAEGAGHFSLHADALVSENDNKGNEIVLGAQVWIDRTSPASPTSIILKKKGEQ